LIHASCHALEKRAVQAERLQEPDGWQDRPEVRTPVGPPAVVVGDAAGTGGMDTAATRFGLSSLAMRAANLHRVAARPP
jgi:hypothetical protein